jgi:hypothetical protein
MQASRAIFSRTELKRLHAHLSGRLFDAKCGSFSYIPHHSPLVPVVTSAYDPHHSSRFDRTCIHQLDRDPPTV